MIPLSRAAAALARYAQMLKGMYSSDLLLAPLRNQEAVISSRMEGTVSTLDEVLRYEADQDDAEEAYSGKYRMEAIEFRSTALRSKWHKRVSRKACPSRVGPRAPRIKYCRDSLAAPTWRNENSKINKITWLIARAPKSSFLAGEPGALTGWHRPPISIYKRYSSRAACQNRCLRS